MIPGFDEFFYEWLILAMAQLLALIAPGPDFIMSVRNSLVYGRRAGIFTAAGFAGGIAIHCTYCIFGIAAIISQSIMLFSIIKYIGAGYLIYIGVKALRSKGYDKTIDVDGQVRIISDFAAFRSGFITNLFNPKATLFFLALFTQFISPETPPEMLLLYGITCTIQTFFWFSFVTLILTQARIRAAFLRFTKIIDRLCGGLMVALGLRLALAKASV
jgi:RhtB (resistance to homoserine/threonine) family protein